MSHRRFVGWEIRPIPKSCPLCARYYVADRPCCCAGYGAVQSHHAILFIGQGNLIPSLLLDRLWQYLRTQALLLFMKMTSSQRVSVLGPGGGASIESGIFLSSSLESSLPPFLADFRLLSSCCSCHSRSRAPLIFVVMSANL